MGNDNILIVVVLAAVAYVVMTGMEAKAAVTSACSRGQFYRMGIGEWLSLSVWGCDPGYTMTGVGVCTCQTPSSIPGAAHSPQIPTPTPTKCPWDPNLLIGDRRCGTQKIDYPTSPTDPGCVSGEYYLDIPTGTFRRCP